MCKCLSEKLKERKVFETLIVEIILIYNLRVLVTQVTKHAATNFKSNLIGQLETQNSGGSTALTGSIALCFNWANLNSAYANAYKRILPCKIKQSTMES